MKNFSQTLEHILKNFSFHIGDKEITITSRDNDRNDTEKRKRISYLFKLLLRSIFE